MPYETLEQTPQRYEMRVQEVVNARKKTEDRGSLMKPMRSSGPQNMPFEFNEQNSEDRGGEPHETSIQNKSRGGGAYGMQGKPNDKQRTFILESNSDQLGGIMSNNSSLQIKEVNNIPMQKVLDSLPGSLKDSEESLASLKNLSRYDVRRNPSTAMVGSSKSTIKNRFVPDPERVAKLGL